MARPRLFIDTSAFFALVAHDDRHHDSAQRFHKQLLKKKTWELVTSEYVVSETLTLLRSRKGNHVALHFGTSLLQSQIIAIQPVTSLDWRGGWEIFYQYEDHPFSFVDCISFALMRSLKITAAFAFDPHFQEFGFITSPKDPCLVPDPLPRGT
ncbi:MAG: PIN domain-containing protein [Armatimonadetes bacterium]|nr:PIN domain-containing protein [Armatimonadota bacterium]